MNLMILDDEWYAVKGLSAGVPWADAGIERVFEAFSAEEARGIFEKNAVEIVLCDIEMPQEDGISFAVWAQAQRPECRVIFLTGHANFEYAQRAIQAHAYDYILKPVDHARVAQVVRGAVSEIQEEAEQRSYAERWKEHAARLAAELPERARFFWRNVIDNRLSREFISEWLSLQGLAGEGLRVTPVAVWIEDEARITSAQDAQMASFLLLEALREEWGEPQGCCCMEDPELQTVLLLFSPNNAQERQLPRRMAHIGQRIGVALAWRLGENCAAEALWWSVHGLREQLSSISELPSDVQSVDWEAALRKHMIAPLHGQVDRLLGGAAVPAARAEAVACALRAAALNLSLDYALCARTQQQMSLAGLDLGDAREVARWAHALIDAVHEDQVNGPASGNAIIRGVCLYVHENLSGELTRESIASAVYLNPSYLSRLFRHEMGVTLSEYIVRERMAAAKGMLQDPAVKIGVVAQRVGYPQFSYFCRVFRRVVGMSPQAFQRGTGE